MTNNNIVDNPDTTNQPDQADPSSGILNKVGSTLKGIFKSKKGQDILSLGLDDLTGYLTKNMTQQSNLQKRIRQQVSQPTPSFDPFRFEEGKTQSLPYTQLPPEQYTPIRQMSVPLTTQLLIQGNRNADNPLRFGWQWGDISSRVERGLSPSLGDDPLVVQKGMAERDVSNFGVFSGGAKNRTALLKRRTDMEAEMARRAGDRG